MTEEFDALLSFNPTNTIYLIIGILILGIVLELVLRFIERWAISKNRSLAGVILRSLHWQPLLWCVLFAIFLILASFSEVSVERQRGLEILWSLLLISVTIVGVRIMTGWVRLLTAQKPSASVSVLNYLVNTVAIVIVVMVILFTLNIPTPLLIITFLGSTLGLSLALREPLANLFAGVVLTVSQRLSPGDYVRLPSGEEGRVIDIEWDVTSIQQLSKSQIIVPNSFLTKAELINFDHPSSEYELKVQFGVSYDSDLEHVEQVTTQVADNVLRSIEDGSLAAPSYIRFKSFDDSDIKLAVYLRCQNFADRNRVKHEFIKQIHNRYKLEGIEMPFPVLELHSPSKNQTGSYDLASSEDPHPQENRNTEKDQ
jgi:small-conductance mechanosensitive channel